jgi:hypothetical protein
VEALASRFCRWLCVFEGNLVWPFTQEHFLQLREPHGANLLLSVIKAYLSKLRGKVIPAISIERRLRSAAYSRSARRIQSAVYERRSVRWTADIRGVRRRPIAAMSGASPKEFL